MPERTFGQALGALILQKRRAAGLTQTQLAEDAFQTTAKTRRISELENGTVANPHPKTIDPIISTLKISDA
jgi:transcriptional regulator with XRE-family HTH domain